MTAAEQAAEAGAAEPGAPEPGADGPPPGLSELLRHRDFRLLWLGRNLSRLGDSVYEIAIGWTVYSLTGSVAAMGEVLAAFTVPQVLLTLFGGVLGDRLSRRRILVVTDALSAAATGALAVTAAGHRLTMGVLITVSAVLGALSAFASPAQGPLLGDLLPVRLLRRANIVDNAAFSAMTMAGPALGGLLAAWSTPASLGLDALTFLASLGCVLRLTSQDGAARAEFTALGAADLREGWQYSVRHSWILWLTGLAMLLNVACIAPFYTVLPLRLRELHLPAGVYGLALAAQGLSAVLVSVALGRARRMPRAGLLAPAASLGVAVGVGLLAPARATPVFLLAGACMGLSTAFGLVENLLLQVEVAAAVRSRVSSIITLGSAAPLPLAYVGAGLLAGQVGPTTLTACCGAVGILICLTALAVPALRTLRGPDL